jgi:hypothetical protein
MAINVNSVYRVVLSVLNKEQRGYLTPDQFNRLGKQAQLGLLDKSFYDYNRHLTRRNIQGVNSEYGDNADRIEEKIDMLSREASISLTNGVYDTSNLSDTIYKIIQLTTDSRATEVEQVKKSELTYMNASKLTAPSSDFPAYYLEGENIKVFPTTVSSVVLDYVKKPADPKWAYTTGNGGQYTYDSNASIDFELHPSEETDLVVKILALAGVVIKDPTVIQVAQTEEANNFNQENL